MRSAAPCDLSVIERFETKFIPEPNSGCWIWIAAADKRGYGRFRIGSLTDGSRRTAIATRVAWVIYKGELPQNLDVCHRCDNPPCVNPEHLFLGTCLDNMRDCVSKGRHSYGERHSKIQKSHIIAGPTHPLFGRPGRKGTDHHAAKLTEADVRAIRADARLLALVAADYGMCFQSIWNIQQRKTWKHIV